MHMCTIVSHQRLCLPTSPPVAVADMWLASPDLGEEWRLVLDRIAQLRQAGLTLTMVVADFIQLCIAPLHAWVRPAWFFTGIDDTTCTCRGDGTDLSEVEISELLMLIAEVREPATAILLDGIVLLCDEPARLVILLTLPETDARELIPTRAARPSGGIRIEERPDRSSGMEALEGAGKRRRPPSPVPVGSSSSSSPPPSPQNTPVAPRQGPSSATVERRTGVSVGCSPPPKHPRAGIAVVASASPWIYMGPRRRYDLSRLSLFFSFFLHHFFSRGTSGSLGQTPLGESGGRALPSSPPSVRRISLVGGSLPARQQSLVGRAPASAGDPNGSDLLSPRPHVVSPLGLRTPTGGDPSIDE